MLFVVELVHVHRLIIIISEIAGENSHIYVNPLPIFTLLGKCHLSSIRIGLGEYTSNTLFTLAHNFYIIMCNCAHLQLYNNNSDTKSL